MSFGSGTLSVGVQRGGGLVVGPLEGLPIFPRCQEHIILGFNFKALYDNHLAHVWTLPIIRTHYCFLANHFIVDNCFLTISIFFPLDISLCKTTKNLQPWKPFTYLLLVILRDICWLPLSCQSLFQQDLKISAMYFGRDWLYLWWFICQLGKATLPSYLIKH